MSKDFDYKNVKEKNKYEAYREVKPTDLS